MQAFLECICADAILAAGLARQRRQAVELKIDLGVELVFFAQGNRRKWPVNVEPGIVVAKAALGFGGVIGSVVVDQRCVIFEGLKTVGKPLRNVQHQQVGLRQFDAKVLQESGRVAAQIHDYVVDTSLNASHEFDLAMRWQLVVHAADRSFAAIDGVIELDKFFSVTDLAKIFFAKGAGKQSPLVLKGLWLDDKCAFQWTCVVDHWSEFLGSTK